LKSKGNKSILTPSLKQALGKMINDKIKIAIVDDSLAIRERLQQKIEKNNDFEIIWTAEKLSGAMEEYLKEAPEIMILDIQLQDSSGFKVLENIRKINSDTKIIMLTNFPYATFKNKCMNLGGNYFFDKTNEFEKVFEVLKNFKNEKLN